MEPRPRLALVGLGRMGSGMARNLLRAGYEVAGYDREPARLSALEPDGLVACSDGKAAVAVGEWVLTSLSTSHVFVEVAETVLLPAARPGQWFIDLGTTAPPETRRLAAAFEARGAALIDAPVSGGSVGAEQGMLRIYCGATAAQFARVRPLLEVLGQPERVVHCGPVGTGQVVKGVNQLGMGLSQAIFLEAAALAVRGGASLEAAVQAVGGGEPWRELFSRAAQRVLEGRADQADTKFNELPYYLAEAEAQGFELPLTRALYAFCDPGERVIRDALDLPSPAFWRELMREP